MQQARAFFTLMKPRKRHKQQPLVDCLSKRNSNRFYANQKTLGGICVCSFDVQKPRTTYQLPILYIYICVVAFLKEISLLYKGDTEKQSLLYIGNTESGSQKHDRLFKAVFFVSWETMLCGCKIFRSIQRLRSFSLIIILVMLEYIYSTLKQ